MKDYDILKTHSKNMFLIRAGNYWYEENEIGDDRSITYRACGYFVYALIAGLAVMEVMAACMGDFPKDEKSDATAFAISHPLIVIKIYSIFSKKKLIRDLNRKMVSICQNYEEQASMEEKYKTMKTNVGIYLVTVIGSCILFIFEGLRKLLTGSHFVTIVTYYPPFEDDSPPATFVRVFSLLICLTMVVAMVVSVDTFTMIYFVMYKYKFITLRNYFEQLRREVEELHNIKEYDLAAEKLEYGLVEGIKMHIQLLQISEEIDEAFGTVLALQVIQSTGSTVPWLLELATTDDMKIFAAGKLLFFVLYIFFLLGLFMCNAGEVTYQASLISNTIFYCGWSLCLSSVNKTRQRHIKHLVIQAILQSQKPVIIKAFNTLELNYESFLAVARTTYSVFTLFYAQHNK